MIHEMDFISGLFYFIRRFNDNISVDFVYIKQHFLNSNWPFWVNLFSDKFAQMLQWEKQLLLNAQTYFALVLTLS